MSRIPGSRNWEIETDLTKVHHPVAELGGRGHPAAAALRRRGLRAAVEDVLHPEQGELVPLVRLDDGQVRQRGIGARF